MFTLASEQRPAEAGDGALQLYVRSYLLTRTVVGLLGIALPASLMFGEAFLGGGVRARGSLSAYYHTSMRDLFVGILCVTGVLMITYVAEKWTSTEFWVSTAAGIALLIVAFFPTGRPDLEAGATRCGSGADPVPVGCTALQQWLGESTVAGIHYVAAFGFIVLLALICQAFANDEKRHDATKIRARTHQICRNVIGAALVWIAVGELLDVVVLGLTPLYIGEVAAVLAFGTAWLIKGHDLTESLRAMLPRSRARRASERPAT